MAENGDVRHLKITDIEEGDEIEVNLIPEKKGLFIKHVEYVVISQKFSSQVYRRYNDFVALHELLLGRFPYRLIPKLPPKKIVGVFPGDSNFLENRRKGLQRWLTLISRHPVVKEDALLSFFLTQSIADLSSKMKDVFKSIPDEFTTSDLAAKAKDLVPPNNTNDFATSREQIRIIHHGVHKIKLIADQIAIRSHRYASDMEELGNTLTDLALDSAGRTSWGTGGNNSWSDMRKGFGIISKEFSSLSSKAKEQGTAEEEQVCERLNVLLEILAGHQDLCERVEKGVSHDHQVALSRMMALKKRQIQGVLKGSDAESVAALENRMLQQETVIASVELRTAFSLYCVRMETALVHVYLETLAEILNSLVSVQITAHSELARVWKIIQPTVVNCLPKK
uniref:Sorting nexin-8 n=1 Tax=Lygus hesperus TaxID=30085 RepID=A0A0A9XXK9_LYGHE